ncbi:MAG: hypothetical protein QOK04_1756, partial [Solirubrobacteraceae bacterium]|nr:hypothetical protein [Solirubrobacteraceae bacterium]
INAQIASSQSNPFGGSGSQGSGGRIGFAIPSNTATQVIAALKRAGHVDHAYLGVESATIGDIPAQVAGAKQGVLVQKVQAGGPAAKAGLRGGTHPTSVNGSTILSGGDVIISVDAHPISSAEELSQAVSSLRPGVRLRLEILRSGARQRLTVALGTQPTRAGNG